jgi:glucose/arabinose dehydrogenase
MKRLVIILGVLLLATVTIYTLSQQTGSVERPVATNSVSNATSGSSEDIPAETTIAENLDTPWALALLPDGKLLVTERFGRVTIIDPTGKEEPVVAAEVQNVKEIGEGGLLGIALHPNFAQNRYVYLYYTYSAIANNTLNRVVRMELQGEQLQNEEIIVDQIPGASNHNGGRIAFGPDTFLYIGTGDAQNPSQAQLTNTLGGKILRVTDEGQAAPGNPFNNAVYSYGHRNVQGLTWDASGTMWATEHGRSGITSGLDELNVIVSGSNYGWPTIEGDETQTGMVPPAYHSGGSDTWAPSGAAFLTTEGTNGSLYFSGLRGRNLYQAIVSNGQVTDVREHLSNTYGRIREVIATPDGILYITTSNKDGRGAPQGGDDKIIRVNPEKL